MNQNAIEPTGPSERIRCLDVLRGFAVLGILVPNIQALSMISSAYRNPTAYGDLNGMNFLVWYATNLLFEQKFMTIFSILFGAGIVLMNRRITVARAKPWKTHYQRMFWLLLIGLAHAYLVWYGDILVCYAVTGMIVYGFRNRSPKQLMIFGLLLFAMGSAISLFFGWSMQYWPPEEMVRMRDTDWAPTRAVVESELSAYRGGWLDQMPHRAKTAFFFETALLLILFFWRAGGLMLLGMALFKWGFLTGERSRSLYQRAMIGGLIIGVPLVALENQINLANQFAMEYSFFFGNQINYWASLLISGAYVSAMMLWCQSSWLPLFQYSLASVGRMALTNYISHSVICTLIFYGHGLGYFGYLERSQQILVVISIWIIQLILSPIWLNYFRFGPLEWLWRSLSYRQWQPMKNE